MVLEGECEIPLQHWYPLRETSNQVGSLPVLAVVLIMEANAAWVSFLFSENRHLKAGYLL